MQYDCEEVLKKALKKELDKNENEYSFPEVIVLHRFCSLVSIAINSEVKPRPRDDDTERILPT